MFILAFSHLSKGFKIYDNVLVFLSTFDYICQLLSNLFSSINFFFFVVFSWPICSSLTSLEISTDDYFFKFGIHTL